MREIRVAESAGFCFGVKRSVEMAEKLLEEKGSCLSYGELIHNEDVVSELKRRGLRIAASPEDVRQGESVIIRAHGVPEATVRALEAAGAELYDATCPKVKHIHKIVQAAAAEGSAVLVIGMKNHPEVEAICGWCGECYTVENPQETEAFLDEYPDFSSKPLCVVVQTTQTLGNFNNCIKIIKKRCTNVKIFDTICLATSTRQNEATELASACNAMVVIGGRHSANSVHLAEICREHCRNVQFVERAEELDLKNLADSSIIGITAGASTPSWIIKEVRNKMDELKVEESTVFEKAAEAAEETAEAVKETVTAAAEEAAEAAGEVAEAAEGAVEAVAEAAGEVAEEAAAAVEETVEKAAEEISEAAAAVAEEPAPKKPESDSFDAMLEETLKPIYNGDKVKGVVTGISSTEVTLDLGTKYTGFIPTTEFTDGGAKLEEAVKLGDEISAMVVRVNDVEGTAMLSKKRLDNIRFWDDLEAAAEEGGVVEGTVTEQNKGGVVVNVKGARVFVPASQTDLPREADLAELLKKTVHLKITEVNKARKRIVGSIRRAASAERHAKAAELWENIEVGKKYHSVVKSLTSYGAFCELVPGIDGMVHVSELSWGRLRNPAEVVKVGDELDVYVIGFDKEKRRISLGYKDPEADPWKIFRSQYNVGDVASVKVVKLMQFGAFCEVVPGVDGLVHISQLADHRVAKVEDAVKVGDVVDAKIIAIDDDKQKISLSIRALLEGEPAPAEEAEPEAEEEPAEEPAEAAVPEEAAPEAE